MSTNLTKLLYCTCIFALLLTGCSKKYSSDTPQTPSYSPSVIIGSDNGVLYALEPTTGTKNWEYSLPQAIYASPVVYNNMVYVGVANVLSGFGSWDTLYKINAMTGKLVKKLVVSTNQNFSIKATPVIDNGVIYLATTKDSVYALDTGTAKVKWAFGDYGAQFIASPTLSKGFLYCASTTGKVYCLKQSDGTQVWSYTNPNSAAFYSSPSIGDSFLFIGCNDSSCYCLYLTSFGSVAAGSMKWSYKTGGAVTSSPASYHGNCVFGSNDFNVYCIDVETGLKKWMYTTTSNINMTSPVINNQIVYIGSNDYNMYALDMIDGHQRWKFSSNGLIASSPLSYGGRIYFGSYDNTLYSIDSLGTLKWAKYIGAQMECSPVICDFSNNQYNSQVSGYTN